MWFMTKYGFFSIVCAWKDKTDYTPHPDLMMMRARKKEHLQNLKKRFRFLQDYEIIETQNTDYPFRMIVDKMDATMLASEISEEIDYCNFKDKVHSAIPDDTSYHSFLMEVWSKGLNM